MKCELLLDEPEYVLVHPSGLVRYIPVCTGLYNFKMQLEAWGWDKSFYILTYSGWCFGLSWWRMRLGVLNDGSILVWWYTSKIMLPDYLESFDQYIPVCTLYVLSTYQYHDVLELESESPKSFWLGGYYVLTFDTGKRYCVYGTGTWWSVFKN